VSADLLVPRNVLVAAMRVGRRLRAMDADATCAYCDFDRQIATWSFRKPR
jgi:hypothetical protein